MVGACIVQLVKTNTHIPQMPSPMVRKSRRSAAARPAQVEHGVLSVTPATPRWCCVRTVYQGDDVMIETLFASLLRMRWACNASVMSASF